MFYILIVIVMLGCPLRCSSQPRTPYITQSTCQCLSYLSADILACLFGTFGEKLTASIPKVIDFLFLRSRIDMNGFNYFVHFGNQKYHEFSIIIFIIENRGLFMGWGLISKSAKRKYFSIPLYH